MPPAAPVLALDLGGSRIRAAIVRADGSRHSRVEAATPASGRADVVAACSAALRETLGRATSEGSVQRLDLAGIGISAPGPVDPRTGVVLEPPNLGADFRNVPLAAEMAAALGLPAALDRDTNVALLGEAAYGAARGESDAVYITVSTGVGGAILSGGAILHGPDGLAGELGHLAIELDGPRCGCGGIGHVEAIASGTALARDAEAAATTGASPFLQRRALDGRPLSARDVTAGVDAGDATCIAILDRAKRAVAAACVSVANAYNPHLIVIGGAIALALGESLLAPVRAVIAADVFPVIGRRIRVVGPGLGDDISLAGAWPLVHARSPGSPSGVLRHTSNRSRARPHAEPHAAREVLIP